MDRFEYLLPLVGDVDKEPVAYLIAPHLARGYLFNQPTRLYKYSLRASRTATGQGRESHEPRLCGIQIVTTLFFFSFVGFLFFFSDWGGTTHRKK